MVAKRVQHVGFNNVGWCCTTKLDIFSEALTTRNVVVDESKKKNLYPSRPPHSVSLITSSPVPGYFLEK